MLLESKPRFSLVIPVLNAASVWKELHAAIEAQSVHPETILIINSDSDDGTAELVAKAGYRMHSVRRAEFNHGRTRQLAADMLAESELLIYLTQDAIPHDAECFANILRVFADAKVGAAFGRQLPRTQAGVLEAHARRFNYTATSRCFSFEDRQRFGFKCVYASNSFAAYRHSALNDVGGFPTNTIVSEETITFARMQMKGWKTAYAADSSVIHSHDYTIRQEFSRYFDIGVGYERASWILDHYNKLNGEGLRFLRSELQEILPGRFYLLPEFFMRASAKFVGYKLGCMESHLPLWLKRRISAQKAYWK